MLKFEIFAPTKNAGQNPGTTKIPFPLRAGDKKLKAQILFMG